MAESERGVYIISVAALLVSAHPRTLRIYETQGLVSPMRHNNLRLYSDLDIERILLIRHLTGVVGVNLAGIRLLLRLYDAGRFELIELVPAYRQPPEPVEPTPPTTNSFPPDSRSRDQAPEEH